MLCAISGEAPQEPVASKKSGHVFEKRLIETYISEHGSDPVTGEETTVEDLVPLRNANVVRPRPPTLTSIPALLSVLQDEWDANALESYQLKQQLTQLRQELSHALYYNDAAVRVIARLQKERDEARDALGRIPIHEHRANAAAAAAASGNGNVEAMQVDGQGLPAAVVSTIESTQEALSKTRRKRPVPEDWAEASDIQNFKESGSKSVVSASSSALAVNSSGDKLLIGGNDGALKLTSTGSFKSVKSIKTSNKSPVTGAIWTDSDGVSRTAVATGSGAVSIYNGDKLAHTFETHAGTALGVAAHPSANIIASIGSDRSFVIYDLEKNAVANQTFIEAVPTTIAIHPDGHLLAIGTSTSSILLFDLKTLALGATFTPAASTATPITSLSFSENGTWLASSAKDSSTVSVWDLRKGSELKTLEYGGPVEDLAWDYTGRFLAGTGPTGTVVSAYEKSEKSWSEPLRSAVPGVKVVWGASAKVLVVLSPEGKVVSLSA